MARPTRTNAEYFYHPATFRNDRRVKAIRARYGACGYGLLMMLIELLTDADNTALPTDEMEIELLAGDLSATVEDVTNLIQAAEKVGLFARSDAGLLKCPQLDEWLAPVFDKRNRSRNTATAPNLSQPVTETPVSVTETPPVKESREQYSTEENSKEVSTSNEVHAANAAALGSEKKIESLALHPTSPEREASHTRGPADVPTRKSRKPVLLLTGPLGILLNPGGLADSVQGLKKPFTQAQADQLVSDYGAAAATEIVQAMANHARLGSYVSSYLTANNWLSKRKTTNAPPHATPSRTTVPANGVAARLQIQQPDAAAGWGYPAGNRSSAPAGTARESFGN